MSASGYERLERLLDELTRANEQMLEAVRSHRAALARADLAGMSAAITVQGELARRIGLLNEERAAVVAEISGVRAGVGGGSHVGAVRPGAKAAEAAEPKLSRLIEAAPAAQRTRLEGMRLLLRDVLERLTAEQRALKDAAGALAGHMEGVMRQIHDRVAHAGTYVRTGRIDTSVRVVSALDIRT